MAAATTLEEAKITIKLMLQKDKNKVIFAEADYNFVDILFSFMTLPLATIVRILEGCPDKKDVALPGVTNLYQSLKDLPENHFSTEESKYILLNPRNSAYDVCRKLKLNIDDAEPLKYFICRNFECSRYKGEYSLCKFAKCSICGNLMNQEIMYNSSIANTGENQVIDGVFVSNITTFLVTDDLSVMPNTSDFCVYLLCDHGITDRSQLEERTFDIGREQILIILKGALLSSFSLTYLVFPGAQFKLDLVGTLVQPVVVKKEGVSNTKRLNLKVTLQKSTSKFLYAEAEEDFVDFVFGFLVIPLGVVGKLLDCSTFLVSLDNLIDSICDIGEGKYLKSKEVIDMFLEPKFCHKCLSKNNIFSFSVLGDPCLYFHYYWNHYRYVMYLNKSSTSGGGTNETVRSLCLKDPRVDGSFLKAATKFMLTDDLHVTPLSSFSTIALLDKLKVPLNDVESHKLSIGVDEGLKILKASLMSSVNCSSPLINSLLQGNGLK